MSYRDWHVGMRVVCVDAEGWWHKLTEGTVYTIADIVDGNDRIYAAIKEVPREDGEPGRYFAHRFRPLDESRLDIFRAHLAPSPKNKVRA